MVRRYYDSISMSTLLSSVLVFYLLLLPPYLLLLIPLCFSAAFILYYILLSNLYYLLSANFSGLAYVHVTLLSNFSNSFKKLGISLFLTNTLHTIDFIEGIFLSHGSVDLNILHLSTFLSDLSLRPSLDNFYNGLNNQPLT